MLQDDLVQHSSSYCAATIRLNLRTFCARRPGTSQLPVYGVIMYECLCLSAHMLLLDGGLKHCLAACLQVQPCARNVGHHFLLAYQGAMMAVCEVSTSSVAVQHAHSCFLRRWQAVDSRHCLTRHSTALEPWREVWKGSLSLAICQSCIICDQFC